MRIFTLINSQNKPYLKNVIWEFGKKMHMVKHLNSGQSKKRDLILDKFLYLFLSIVIALTEYFRIFHCLKFLIKQFSSEIRNNQLIIYKFFPTRDGRIIFLLAISLMKWNKCLIIFSNMYYKFFTSQ